MMTPKIDSWTVVLSGQWNVKIFTPEWLAQHVFLATDVALELNLGPVIQGIRLTNGNMVIYPASDRLIFGVRTIDDLALRRVENGAIAILNLLPHTPLAGVGINFGFVESQPDDDALALFGLNDIGRLSDAGCEIERTELARKMRIGDRVLNLKNSLQDGSMEIDFNFHKDTKTSEEAVAVIREQVLLRRDEAVRLLSDAYHITYESPGVQNV